MPPFILALLSQGLGLIGNAALVKGKEWVEEKTGVKLQPDMPPEDLVKLKQYELKSLGDWWEALNPKNRWGGNWRGLVDAGKSHFIDCPHFERQV